MVTKNLTDLTNSVKSGDKTIVKEVNNLVQSILANNDMSYGQEMSIEASMNDHQASKSLLPLADSMIDADASKIQQTFDINNKLPGDLDELDQMGGPASIYNPIGNMDEMLDDLPNQKNLETTPGKNETLKEGDEDSDEEVEDKKAYGKSPNASQRKRHYKRSIINASLNKENTNTTTNRNEEEENIYDDTLNSDPSKNLNKRAKTMVSLLNKSLSKHDNVGFFEITRKTGRKHAVQKFYSLLVLKKYEIIELSQEETYSDIIICKGEKFDTFAPN